MKHAPFPVLRKHPSTFKLAGLGSVLAAGLLSASAWATPVQCQNDNDTGCWRQITNANFKDFAVGTGLVCLVGGNVMPPDISQGVHSDPFLHPNNYSQNQGTEDQVECHKPTGVSGISNEPFFPGYGADPNTPGRVPGGIYDDGWWAQAPTGVITLYGEGGDDIAVLNTDQHVYVASGDRNNFKTGGNYATWQLDRKNIDANTGATICLKGLFTTVAPTGNTWWLMGLGCSGEIYAAHDGPLLGWLKTATSVAIDAGGGDQSMFWLTSSLGIKRESYRAIETMPALPSGFPKALGFRYVLSNDNNRIYEASNRNSLWTFRDVDYPASFAGDASLEAIDSGERFRGVSGEFFAWHNYERVYLYYPAPVPAPPMMDIQIGSATGTRTQSLTQETMTSTGGDIYGGADTFTYWYRPLAGDGVAVTKVVSQSAVSGALDPYAKAGIMIRESTASNAANVFLGKTPSGATIQQRVTAGAASTAVTNVSAPVAPMWFRTIRTRNTFIGSMSTDGSSWTQVGDPVVFTNFAATPLVGLGVSSHSSSAVTRAVADSTLAEAPGFEWQPGLSSLFSPWLDATMGMPGGSHARDQAGTTDSITASGADIYNYSDQFFFAFQNVTGNATIVAKVTSIVPVAPATMVNGYAKAGVMFRDSATGGAPNAFVAITAAQGGTFQDRVIAGAATPAPAFLANAGGKAVSVPFWIKATRTGAQSNVYSGFVSPDGLAPWVPVGAPTTLSNIGATALVGLAVTSHDATKSVKATFSNVVITQP